MRVKTRIDIFALLLIRALAAVAHSWPRVA